MASVTLNVSDRHAPGVVVGAYPRASWASWQLPPSGTAVGAATATGTVAANGTVAITGLADNTPYYAGRSTGVGGYVSFSTPAPGTGGASPSGAAGGVLGGSYPNPAFAADMATQAELDAAGGSDVKRRLWMPAGAIDEAFPRQLGTATLALVSGTLRLNGGAVIRTGVSVTSISFYTTVSVVTPTHQWFCLVRQSDNAVLAKTVNDTTTAWPTGSPVKTLAIAGGPYVPVADAAVWLGIVVVAGTPPTLQVTASGSTVAGQAPGPISCAANTGLTDPASLGATVTPGANAQSAYGFYS